MSEPASSPSRTSDAALSTGANKRYVPLKVLSLFAGVGGLDLAAERAGMTVVAHCEIDKAARAVLQRRFPDALTYDDVRTLNPDELRAAGAVPDLICGGFPCQDLSVAGRRAGLAGARSGLFYEITRLAAELRPRWLCLENVPGLLSSNDGRDMGAVLGALGELGYGWAYRVLDAQYFGVPQRRRRVFIVGCLGDGAAPVEVLLEPEGSDRDLAPRRETGTRVAALTRCGLGGGGADDNLAQAGHVVATTLTAREGKGPDSDATTTLIAVDLRNGSDTGDVAMTLQAAGAAGERGRSINSLPHVVTPIDMRQASRGETMTNNRAEGSSGGAPGTGIGQPGDPCPTLADSHTPAIAHTLTGEGFDASEDDTGRGTPLVPLSFMWQAGGNNSASGAYEYGMTPTLPISQTIAVQTQLAVRRLTPMECERLQGFPDGWTDGQADSARYRQMGNAVAVPVVEWILHRLAAVDARAEVAA